MSVNYDSVEKSRVEVGHNLDTHTITITHNDHECCVKTVICLNRKEAMFVARALGDCLQREGD